MAKRTKTAVNETLSEFLFSRIKNDSEYQEFRKNPLPQYITDNIHPSKKLRPYQEEAVKYFIYLYEKEGVSVCKHLLFNMATGAGKTLVMACCMLYLYEQGYRKFIFLVHQVQILTQARKNFTDYKFEKYLFHPDRVSFYGREVRPREITTFDEAGTDDINIMFLSTSLFYNRIKESGENQLTSEDFSSHDVVIIADEAHRLNVETRSNKTEIEELLNWESAVQNSIGARPTNILIEFTATVDLANRNIHEKYRDKLVYKYDFLDFNKAGYAKDVQFLYNNETQVEDQKKYLIVHAVALSQYRKILFRELTGTIIHPVILVKSKRIADSEADRAYFDTIISELSVRDLDKLRHIEHDEYHLIANLFGELENRKIPLEAFIASIREDFAPQHTMIYNSKARENANALSDLDKPTNRIRVIFSVNALNEGWDVLSLYDIIHFDIGEDKKVSLQDIQLIGRGARYCRFDLPESFQDGLMGSYDTVPDRRKFDKARTESARILETFFYHFVKTGMFLENLRKELMGEGIISEGVEKRTVEMKPHFLSSETYKKGFVLQNRTEKRQKTTEDEKKETFDKIITVSSYDLYARGLTDREENQKLAEKKVGKIGFTEDFFSIHILRKALVRAENGFFRFENLREHITDLTSIDDFISRELRRYTIEYFFDAEKEIFRLSPHEKLQLLIGAILPEVRKHIDMTLPKIVGSPLFRPVSIEYTFSRQKDLFFASFPMIHPDTGKLEFARHDERMKPQTDNPNTELELDISQQDWYAYSENYGTSEEKKFVCFMESKMDSLRKRYSGCEIFLVRNELEYWMFGLSNGKRFSPDYLMFINDTRTKKLYYQCVFEVKGSHLEQKDEWKEKALREISEQSKLSWTADKEDGQGYQSYIDSVKAEGYESMHNIGFGFYNSEGKQYEFIEEFDEKLLNL